MELKITRNNIVLFFISLIVVMSLVLDIDNYPSFWFDEGWIMSVAQNWIKLGHYCQLLNGKPIPTSMLNVGFPAIGPIALSFSCFGVGIWQGRLPSVLFTASSFFLIYQISKYLYGRVVATATLIIALFVLPTLINPIYIGRQALGEMPAMFYLLVGYFFLMFAWRNSLSIALAAIFYGLAMVTKQQIVPFLILALLIPLVILIVNRDWKHSRIMGSIIIATLIIYMVMYYIQGLLVGSHLPQGSQTELYLTTAFVPDLKVRLRTFYDIIRVPSLLIIALGYGLYDYICSRQTPPLNNNVEIIHLSLVILAGTWCAWYILLSIGWPRYLFPSAFISTIFIASLLKYLTQSDKSCNRLLIVLTILILTNPFSNLSFVYSIIVNNKKSSVVDVANYINNYTNKNALIETYDKELFIFLDRRYHYPSDLIQLQLNRRLFMQQNVKITYDPLQANPDYLIIGPMTAQWGLYDKVLNTGEFRFIKKIGEYKIYSRVRSTQDPP